jgi:hypothetical protein
VFKAAATRTMEELGKQTYQLNCRSTGIMEMFCTILLDKVSAMVEWL